MTKALTLNIFTQYICNKRTEELEEKLFCRDRSVKDGQTITIDDAESSTNFDNCTTQAGIAVEISQ